MAFHPFEVTPVHLGYTLLGGFVVLFMMFSMLIKEKLYIGEAVVSTIFGIIIGPYCAGIFDPRHWGASRGREASEDVQDDITLEITRVVIALGVFAIGVELPRAYMKRHWKSIAMLLLPVMCWGWVVSAALMYGLIENLNFIGALTIAATVTPTDPILAAAVVGGRFANKHVPSHLRHLLTAESGCNDGAAFPFLYIGIYLLLSPSDVPYAVEHWILVTWLYEVTLGIVLGVVLGYAARKIMRYSESKGWIDRQSFVAQYVSLALLSIGVTTLLGSDDLLAAFSCGTAFAWDGFFNKATEESHFSNVIDLLFNCAAFIYIGALVPFDAFNDEALGLKSWKLVVLALCILILRRLPVILALYRWIPDIKTFREALFAGHFGPIGVGAIFISTLAASKLPHVEGEPQNQAEVVAMHIKPVVSFLVLVSVLIHGLSIPFFSLGRRVHTIRQTTSISRTFSRNPSASGNNDWMHRIRHVTPGEDIVINRDEVDLERGEGGRVKTVESSSTEGSDSSRTRTEPVSGGGDGGKEQEKRVMVETDMEKEKAAARQERGRARREGSPEEEAESSLSETPEITVSDDNDGTPGSSGDSTKTQAWVEGSSLVIEKQDESGGDPDVTVFKNAIPRNKSPQGRQQVASNLAEEIMSDLSHEKDTLKHETAELKKISPRAGEREEGREGEGEGEASEAGSSTPQPSRQRSQSRSSSKSPRVVYVSSRPGRHESIRRKLFGHKLGKRVGSAGAVATVSADGAPVRPDNDPSASPSSSAAPALASSSAAAPSSSSQEQPPSDQHPCPPPIDTDPNYLAPPSRQSSTNSSNGNGNSAGVSPQSIRFAEPHPAETEREKPLTDERRALYPTVGTTLSSGHRRTNCAGQAVLSDSPAGSVKDDKEGKEAGGGGTT